jgi:PAS domain S-box-containing protein
MQPLTLASLLGLAIAIGAAAGRAWAIGRGAKVRRFESSDRLALLEQRLAEQRASVDHAQAARAAAEADLRASEQRYVAALRGSQDGLWEWDLATGNVALSPRWKSMLGFEAHELADDLAGWRSRVHADDRAALEQALAQHLEPPAGRDDSRFDHELRLLHKDGSVRWVLSRGVAIRKASGAPYRMVGLDTDITRLKRVLSVLDAVAAGTAGALGEKFFPAMVQHFARALGVDRAFVTECADHPTTRVRTLGYWSGDGLRENIEYALAGTPCEAVVQGEQACFHRSGLAQMFPREAGFEAFLGMPMIASDGRLLGHLAIFSRRPLGDEVLVDSVYRIFLARGAAELERIQALARLRETSLPGVPAA